LAQKSVNLSKQLLVILLLVGLSSCTNSITKQSMQLCHDEPYKRMPDSKALTNPWLTRKLGQTKFMGVIAIFVRRSLQ